MHRFKSAILEKLKNWQPEDYSVLILYFYGTIFGILCDVLYGCPKMGITVPHTTLPTQKKIEFLFTTKKRERKKDRFYQGAIFPNKATKKGEWKGEKKIPVLSGGYCCKHRNKEGEFVFLNSTNRYKVVTLVLQGSYLHCNT